MSPGCCGPAELDVAAACADCWGTASTTGSAAAGCATCLGTVSATWSGIAFALGSVVGGGPESDDDDEAGAIINAIASSADIGTSGTVGESGTLGGHFTTVFFLAGVAGAGGGLGELGPFGRGLTGVGAAVIALAAATVLGAMSFANVGPGGTALPAFLETAPVAAPGGGAVGVGEPDEVALATGSALTELAATVATCWGPVAARALSAASCSAA